jgi:hypothetical protein
METQLKSSQITTAERSRHKIGADVKSQMFNYHMDNTLRFIVQVAIETQDFMLLESPASASAAVTAVFLTVLPDLKYSPMTKQHQTFQAVHDHW